ncbi:MAG: hypothetical protein AAF533_15635 [Acidobacteriota bacterium]
MSSSSGVAPGSTDSEVLLLLVGPLHYVVPRDQVRAIHDRMDTHLPMRSLSELLGFGPARSDDRVLEVEWQGNLRGLAVTGIAGIRQVRPGQLRGLPALVERNCPSMSVLGLVVLDTDTSQERDSDDPGLSWESLAVALDLDCLFREHWPAVPEPQGE